MDPEALLLICAAFFALAALYSAVGQAGASGYLAVLALAAVAPDVMRSTALALNVLVAGVTVYRFRRAGHIRWRPLWPFLAGSLPLAALGGALQLERGAYHALVGALLLLSAAYVAWRAIDAGAATADGTVRAKPIPALAIGAAVGFASGLTGIGGGILLSPLLLALGWAGARAAAGMSAPFNLANSLVALASVSLTTLSLPAELPAFAASAIAGALVGTWLGLEKLNPRTLLAALALVLALAGARLLLAALAQSG